jgi:hypothetical protein
VGFQVPVMDKPSTWTALSTGDERASHCCERALVVAGGICTFRRHFHFV